MNNERLNEIKAPVKPNRWRDVCPCAAGTFLGVVFGSAAFSAALGERAGDIVFAIPFFCFASASGLAGASAGATLSALQSVRTGKGSSKQVKISSVVLLVSLFILFGQWRELQNNPRLHPSHDHVAQADLRNARTSLEAYYADHRQYPKNLLEIENMQYAQTRNVVFTYRNKGKDKYELEAYHEKGAWEYRTTSDDGLIYCRKHGNKDAAWELTP